MENADVRFDILSSHTKLKEEMGLDEETVAKSAEDTIERQKLNSVKLANKALLWYL